MPSLYDPSPTTAGDIHTVFRVNTDNAVIALVADCAAGLRTQWLEIAMEMGVFDFTDEVAARGVVDRSTACIECLVGILAHTESITLTEDPEFGKLAIPVSSHKLSRDAKTLGPFVETLAARLIKDREGIVSTFMFDFASDAPGHEGDAGAKALLKQANRSLAVLMALAAAMDLPETVRAIRWSTPTAHQEGLPAEWLGEAFKNERINPTKRLDVAPAFFAVFHSSTEALKAFAPKPQKPGKGKAEEGLTAKNFVPMFVENIDDKTTLRHDAAAMLNDWEPSCAPSTLALSWRERLDPARPAPEDDMTALNALACKAIYRYSSKANPFAPQIPAFEAIGAFDFRPDRTICEAVESGRAAYVERFKGQVPWTNREFAKALESLLSKAIEEVKGGNPKEETEAAMVALMRLAVEDGQQAAFFKTHLVTNKAMSDFLGESIVQPVCALIEGQFNKVLVGFLENGMSPTAAMAPDSVSLLDYAQAVNAKDAANVMRSFVARHSAHDILNEIDLSPFMLKAKP